MPNTAKEKGESSKRSCILCSQRKVRCDKKHPCGQCIKSGAECIYPGSKRAPRKLNRPPISEIYGRLKELEEEVEQIRSGSRSSAAPDAGAPSETSKVHRGRLVVQEGKSRYVGEEASVVLGDKIQELQEVCDISSDEESLHSSRSTRAPIVPSLGFQSGDPSRSPSTVQDDLLHPPRIQALWQVYRENVAPLIAILHIPSIEPLVSESPGYVELDTSHQALISVICFAAVLSMSPTQCLAVLGQDHDTMVQTYRSAAEHALSRTNLINTQDVRVLQAAVLFLLCVRLCGDSRLIWAEAAIVVRVAQRQGIHRDGQQLGLNPFDVEMRRRLWWHICLLDILCSEDQGTDTQIKPGMFDTQVPSNIDSNQLNPSLPEIPPEQTGYTDITLLLIHCEMITKVYWSTKSLGQNPHTRTKDRENLVSTMSSHLEERFLKHLDMNNPIQWMTAVIARLTLSKAWLVTRLDASTNNPLPDTGDQIFKTAVEIVKFTHLLETNESTAKWGWLCKSYKQLHAVAFILSELCTRPITSETNHAWEVVLEIYSQWEREPAKTNSMLQKPLSRLFRRTALSRQSKLGETPLPEVDGQSAVHFSMRNDIEGTKLPIDPAMLSVESTLLGPETEHPNTTISGQSVLDAEMESPDIPDFSLPTMDWITGSLW